MTRILPNRANNDDAFGFIPRDVEVWWKFNKEIRRSKKSTYDSCTKNVFNVPKWKFKRIFARSKRVKNFNMRLHLRMRFFKGQINWIFVIAIVLIFYSYLRRGGVQNLSL